MSLAADDAGMPNDPECGARDYSAVGVTRRVSYAAMTS